MFVKVFPTNPTMHFTNLKGLSALVTELCGNDEQSPSDDAHEQNVHL